MWYHGCMKRTGILFIAAFILLASATPLHARWIGEMQRDYSLRLEQERISREGIQAQRDARAAQRLNVRDARSRFALETNIVEDPNQNFAVRASVRARRLNDRLKLGDSLRLPKTEALKSITTKTKSDVRMDARRRADLGSILNVLIQYVTNPSLEGAGLIPASRAEICRSRATNCDGFINLDDLIVGSELAGFPVDPGADPGSRGTGYYIEQAAGTALKLEAPLGNGGEGVIMQWTKP